MRWDVDGQGHLGTAADGAAWRIRAARTVGDAYALYRTPAGMAFPEDPDEERDACAILRSPGEARIMADLLDGPAEAGRMPDGAYRDSYEHEGRRGWWRGLADGYLSVSLGSDEDPRSVVVTRFRRRDPAGIRVWSIVSHGAGSNMPEGGAALPATLELTSVILGAERQDRPLDEADHRLWASGLAVVADPPREVAAPDLDGAAAEGARLAREGFSSDLLLQAALQALRGLADGAGKKAVESSVAVQFALVATMYGRDVADDIVAAGSVPAPGR